MPSARMASSIAVALGVLLSATGGAGAHHLGHPHLGHVHGVAGALPSDAHAFELCTRPSPSKSYYWKSLEHRQEASCPQWRRVMAKATVRTLDAPHR